MITTAELLVEAYGRLPDLVTAAVEGLSVEHLHARLDAGANPIAWLVWHLVRVQDDHVAGAFEVEQVWTREGWARRWDLPLDDDDLGYGHSSEQVAAVRVDDPDLLLGYARAVHVRTVELLTLLADDDLDRVVDASYDPPVTLGVRLVSVLEDDLQHAGQAAYVRGVLERTGAR